MGIIVDLARPKLDRVAQCIGYQHLNVLSLGNQPLSLWKAIDHLASIDLSRFRGLQIPRLRGFRVREPSEHFEQATREIEQELMRLDPNGEASEAFLAWRKVNIWSLGYYDVEIPTTGKAGWKATVKGIPSFDAQSFDIWTMNDDNDYPFKANCIRCGASQGCTLVTSPLGALCLPHARRYVLKEQLGIIIPLQLLCDLIIGAVGYGVWYILWIWLPNQLHVLLS